MRNSGATRLILRLACFFPLAAAPLVTNWICGQPAMQRRVARELDGIVDTLVSGAPVWTDDDMRILKEAWIFRMPAAKSVLILGGSRAEEISGDWFRLRTTLNAAVLGGDMQDMISIFQICVEAGKPPREVVLDLNPSLIKELPGDNPRQFGPYFHRALERYELLPLLSFVTDYTSVAEFRHNIVRMPAPLSKYWPRPMPRSYRVLPDGSFSYSARNGDPKQETVEATVESNLGNLDGEVRRWRTTSQPGESDLKFFRRFLDDLQSRGIRVTVLLAPVHPVAYDYYAAHGGYDETWIRREMASRNITVAGSYSPAIAHATKSDFYDDVHPRAPILRRLLSEAGVIEPQR